MDRKILIAYASKYGATREIAEEIGALLCQSGWRAETCPVASVRGLASYQAVILGSAVYVGQWPKAAAAFLLENEKMLAERPVWLFSNGPTGEGDPVKLVNGELLPEALRPVAERIRPRGVAVFHGYINPAKLNFLEKWAIKSIVKKPMGDFWDWEAIRGWAGTIAGALQAGASAC